MKKTIIVIGAFLISLLLVSTVTAVPQTQSKPSMDIIEKIEHKKSVTETLQNKIDSITSFQKTGLIDWIVQLLTAILNLIQALIQFVMDLFNIVNLINAIISAINQLINLIVQFINAIIAIFTPDVHYC